MPKPWWLLLPMLELPMLELLMLPALSSAAAASSVSNSTQAGPWRNLQSGAGYGTGSTQEPCSAAGAALTAVSGSLDFFDGHADGDVCSWMITCPATGGTPVLVFTDFDTEANYDWVDVYSGSDASGGLSTRLAHLSGAGLSSIGSPGPYSAWTHTMYVRFSADQSIGGQGFVAQYNCHGGEAGAPILPPPANPCAGGVTLTESGGTIDFFDGHDHNAECSWTIRCPDGPTVGVAPTLIFTQFDTEAGYDFVDVFDGSPTSHQNQRLAHLSGSNVPASSFRAHQGNNAMTVRFTSDASVGGRGFAATYSCQSTADAYATIARNLLETPACAPLQDQVGFTSTGGSTSSAAMACPLQCAELWLPAAERLTDPQAASAFEVAAPGVTSSCRAASEATLTTAPRTVTVSGLRCHPTANAVYTLQPALLNSRPHYATANSRHLYWASDSYGDRWYLDDDTGNDSIVGYLDSVADSPPTGLVAWREFCNQEWGDTLLTVVAHLSAENCAALANDALAMPACSQVQAQAASAIAGCTTSSEAEIACPLPCAELWLPAAARCTDPQAASAFEAAAPGVTSSCRAATEASLATAPRAVTMSGLRCHPTANAAYALQPAPLNGRPHYATANGGLHLYWTRHGGLDGAAGWVLDPDTNDADYEASLFSAADAPPTGSAVWDEYCGGSWMNARLQLTASRPDAGQCATALQRLAPRLTATCCRPEDGPLCGDSGTVPGACGVDCAHVWAPHVEQCPADQEFYGQPELSAFFGGEVRQAVCNRSLLFSLGHLHALGGLIVL
eukprot:COSAG02_NODE_1371_length_13018_cov_6.783265_2_plen_789_part_00